MALPTMQDCKDYLRIDDTTEDGVVAMLLARATAQCTRYLGIPITAISRAQTDDADTRFYSRSPTRLQCPLYPIDAEQAITVEDVDGNVVDPTTYRVDGQLGQIIGVGDTTFPFGPYTITASVGLSAATDYDTVVEPVLGGAIMDFVAELYQNRSPNARSDSAGGGVSTQYAGDAVPNRVQMALDLIKPAGLGA